MISARWHACVLPVAMWALAMPVASQEPAQQAVRIGVILPQTIADPLQTAVIEAAAAGIAMAEEEFSFNAEMFGTEFAVTTIRSDDVVAAADQLVAEDHVLAVIGGYGTAEATALSQWAGGAGVPFINVGAESDTLRNELCGPSTFHVAPSAAMYLDAMAGWYVRAGFRRWYVVQADDAESASQHERMLWTLDQRFFGAEEVGSAVVAPGAGLSEDTIAQIRDSNADLVLLLTGANDQLAAVSALSAAGLEANVAGFPYAETQTRQFFAALEGATEKLGSNFRATAWEATLDAYGARELNARFRDLTGEPMEPSAWAAYQAIKLIYEAAFFSGGSDVASVVAYLNDPSSVFDVWKGIGTSFRPWDRQLRQPVYLVEINSAAEDAFSSAFLVGELPAIYMPGTDPLERLDQLGDLADRSTCQ
ncbi:ABC transporter substrate-binding protein [Devosia rhizoryzae]|uniref:ABC transporter substrate-binding protein n=1 Tax=Devosia rhizoryzae TaxID=2774137 RepID=A0ABX7C8D5_9HYPH|nr:ABC transporter substrate-binding protein [Devosia rhizoryzae]QQR40007.1 ABC transporter substrate-binding protein [Devosia rhizoryzae]